MTRPLNACLSAGLPKKAAWLSSTQSLCAGEGWPPISATQPSVVFLWPWFRVQEEAHALHPFHHLSLLLTGLWKTLLLCTPISDCRLFSTQVPLKNPWLFSERAHADLTPPILEVRGPSLFIFMSLRAQHELYSLELHKCLLGKSWKDGEESRYQCSCHSRVPEKGITRRL